MRRAAKFVGLVLGSPIVALVLGLFIAGVGSSGVTVLELSHAFFWACFAVSVLAAIAITVLGHYGVRYVVLAAGLAALCSGGLLYVTNIYLTKKKAQLETVNRPDFSVVRPVPDEKSSESKLYKSTTPVHDGSSNIQNGSIKQGNNGNIQQVTGSGNTAQNCPNGNCTIVQGESRSAADVCEDTTGLIRRLTDATADSKRLLAYWFSVNPQSEAHVRMRNNVRDKFDKLYRETYWPAVDKTYKELMGRIRKVPPSQSTLSRANLFTLPEAPITTANVEDQLIDLCSLLCEMERENELPKTCSTTEIETDLYRAGRPQP